MQGGVINRPIGVRTQWIDRKMNGVSGEFNGKRETNTVVIDFSSHM